GRQKYNAYCLCKHLVQAVPPPPQHFWYKVVQRHTVPIYQHPCLYSMVSPVSDTEVCPPSAKSREYADPHDGSISDGDNHKWLGNK
ncbi:hypothetical protein OBBRIDRAFT_706520, partial [Obba rivulosa]